MQLVKQQHQHQHVSTALHQSLDTTDTSRAVQHQKGDWAACS